MNSSICIKATFRFYEDNGKMKDYYRTNDRLFDFGDAWITYNIFERMIFRFMGPEEFDTMGSYIYAICQYDNMKEFESGKKEAQALELFMYKNWDRIVNFLKLYGDEQPTLKEIRLFESDLIEEFIKEGGNES